MDAASAILRDVFSKEGDMLSPYEALIRPCPALCLYLRKGKLQKWCRGAGSRKPLLQGDAKQWACGNTKPTMGIVLPPVSYGYSSAPHLLPLKRSGHEDTVPVDWRTWAGYEAGMGWKFSSLFPSS